MEGCDLAIAADTVSMGHPEQKLGLSGAAYFAAWEIVDMGPRKARELLLLAEVWNAEQVLAAGLVNKVVPHAELEQAGEEWAERIVRLPRDGSRSARRRRTWPMTPLHLTSQFAYGYVMHSLATNIRYEPDEFNFMKAKRDKGVRGASHGREDFYKKDLDAAVDK